jgi:hypothetical protein
MMVPYVDFINHFPGANASVDVWNLKESKLGGSIDHSMLYSDDFIKNADPEYSMKIKGQPVLNPKKHNPRSETVKRVGDKFLTKLFDTDVNLNVWE